MKHPKIHVQPESTEKQKGHKSPIHSQKTATPNLANLTQTGLQHLSPADVISLSGIIGNRAVARLMAQRQGEEDELDYPGPRSRRQGEGVLEYPGPRMKPLRENGAQQRGGAELSSSPAQRASPSSSATGDIGDATDLDGEALYGWDRSITDADVARVVNGVIPTMSTEEEFPRIVIFSGTHGNENGDLINDATSRGFVAEDQATADAVMAANPGVEVEVIDVVTSYGTKADLTSVYGMTDYIRILGWCYSARSYWLGDTIRSNWWPAPDNL